MFKKVKIYISLLVIEKAIQYSEKGNIVTFGIVPDSPETGYGYIECSDKEIGSKKASLIKRFIEKLEKEIAVKSLLCQICSQNNYVFVHYFDHDQY